MEDVESDSLITGINIISEQLFMGFTTPALISMGVLVILVFFSGLVSGSETAFFSLSPSDIEYLKLGGLKKNKAIINMLAKPKQLLATILISNNFINVSIVILSTYIVANSFNLEANPLLVFFIQVVVVTSILLIFGEIIPKILSNREPVAVASIMVYHIGVLKFVFKPLISLLVSSTSFIDSRISKKGHNLSMSDLSEAIEITSDRTVTEEEKSILKGITTFGETEASEIMIARTNITALEDNLSISEVRETVLTSGFSRIPVYRGTLDNIIGILYIKDLLGSNPEEIKTPWVNLIRKPVFFVPENKRINDLLQEFRQKKIHLAIVVDEYGGTSGIITLEDIIEEIVGEISDEFDVEPQQFKFDKISSNTFIFEAKTPIVDLCKILEIDAEIFDDVRGESDSLGGLILELQGKIPDKGSITSFENLNFEIVDSDNRKINRVKVQIKNDDVK